MPIQLQAERLLDLPTLPSGWELAATGVGPDHVILVVAADGSFDARRAGRSSRYRVYRGTNRSFEVFEFDGAGRAAYTQVQPMGDRNFLLVTPWIYEATDSNNGHVWNSDGTQVRQFFLGEGINHVQISARLEVWVGYNDESVPMIDDYYALNVASNDEVWVYYYSKFPLVRLVEKRFAGIWPRVPGVGAHAFAVGERSVLFAGDYGDRSSITRYFPESGRMEMGHAVGDGLPLEFTRAIGRADRLYLLADSAIWLLQAD